MTDTAQTFYIVSTFTRMTSFGLETIIKTEESTKFPTGWRLTRTKLSKDLDAARKLIPADKVRRDPGKGVGAQVLEYWS